MVTLLVWLTGELAGLLRGGRWLNVRGTDLVWTVARLPKAASDPRQAWPSAIRAELPSAEWLYAVAAVLTATTASVAVSAWSLMHRIRVHPLGWRGWRQSRGARWATRRDLAPLRARRPGGGRLILGRSGRVLVATEARHSVLVLGPTQSGKTTGLAIPALLEWDGPVLATSVKGDLVSHTRGFRGGRGRTWVFDPTASAGAGPTSRWSPLTEASTWTGAQRMAAWLVEATPSRGGLSEGAFWYSAAAKLLAPLLLAAASGGRSMADVVRWTNLQESNEVEQLLGEGGEAEAGVALWASVGRDERIRSSIYTTLETVLAPYEDPTVVASAEWPDINPAALLEGDHTLYLCGPAHEQARVQGVFGGLVASVVNAAVERVQRLDRPLDPPLLVVLDEVANIAPLRDLDTLASTAAGMGIQLVTVCQDLAQLATRYGTERARTIANNHRAKVVRAGSLTCGDMRRCCSDPVSWCQSIPVHTRSCAFLVARKLHARRRQVPGDGGTHAWRGGHSVISSRSARGTQSDERVSCSGILRPHCVEP
ncbi:MAG TPA: type IV secretory system conjugative DNA transfer family protein [Acidimicrobiales bacterium]|nr:type IV secretory system conjugative DNA transfer family protein [Acidimicrobiales bacterium]